MLQGGGGAVAFSVISEALGEVSETVNNLRSVNTCQFYATCVDNITSIIIDNNLP